jgi:hypothetical protein
MLWQEFMTEMTIIKEQHRKKGFTTNADEAFGYIWQALLGCGLSVI